VADTLRKAWVGLWAWLVVPRGAARSHAPRLVSLRILIQLMADHIPALLLACQRPVWRTPCGA